MLNGLYGYFFGAEETQINGEEAAVENRENEAPRGSGKRVEDDWLLVEECCSGRSSPVLIPQPELQDIDTLSLNSEKKGRTPSPASLRRAEQLRQARAHAAQRLALENALFTETPSTVPAAVRGKTSPPSLTSSSLKRASAVAQLDSKAKPRSKKAGKMSSGRNNDRKVNNLN